MGQGPSPHDVQRALDAIIAEMKAVGMWSARPLPQEALGFREAFAADTMSFAEWLQYVFVPRVQELVSRGGPFPATSEVAVRAVREFDGQGFADLEARLREFDALFTPAA
jgi:uncharacterized protein YqcC (DUF446 family)